MVALTAAAATAATVVKFIGTIAARQYDQLPAFLAPNSIWWTAGNPDLPGDAGGPEDAFTHLDILRFSQSYTNYSVTITNQLTEGKKSAIEVQTVGQGPFDLFYMNNVSMFFTLDQHNKIELVHEWSDRIEINWLLQWFKDHNITEPV
ncbi:hypothetical protein AAE478_003206 [Parahypoxylon ruwenzoriense]